MTATRPIPDDDRGYDLVFIDEACPSCGNRIMDRLVWREDEQVVCTSCNSTYTPPQHDRREGSQLAEGQS